MQTTVSLEVAKLVDALGVECDTDKIYTNLLYSVEKEEWEWVSETFHTIVSAEDNPRFPKGARNRWVKTKGYIIPAPNFQEVLDILPQIGEKLGWDKPFEGNATEFVKKLFANNWKTHAHHLLDAYLSGGMESVGKELQTLLNNK